MDSVSFLAVLISSILAMVVGAVWYGPLFGNKWLEIVGIDKKDLKKREQMQKTAGPLYLVQLLLTIFQVLVLAHLINDTTKATGLERSLWIWAAFVIPTLAGSVMWTNEKAELKKARFLIQGGYQLTIFIIFGLILQFFA